MKLGRLARLLVSPPPADRLARRLAQLLVGLVLYGVSDALLVLGGLGLDPWDVLHQGLARRTGIPIGTWTIIVGAAVLLMWIPLRQRPGVGTACNVIVIGTVIDVVLAVVPAPHALPLRWASLLAGVALNGVATACYIGAGLGPGPRDGLMTGIARRGHSLRLVRTSIELSVLAAGWLLGGTVGIGTVLYAVSIGPLVHLLLPRLTIRPGTSRLSSSGDRDAGPRGPRHGPRSAAEGKPDPGPVQPLPHGACRLHVAAVVGEQPVAGGLRHGGVTRAGGLVVADHGPGAHQQVGFAHPPAGEISRQAPAQDERPPGPHRGDRGILAPGPATWQALAMLVRDQPGGCRSASTWREPARGGTCEAAAAVLPPDAGPTKEETWRASSW